LPDRADHNIYIRNIARAIEPLPEPQSGMFGQQVAARPLAIVLQFPMAAAETIKPPSEEREMLVASLERPGVMGEELPGQHDHRHTPWISEVARTIGIKAKAR
jgi:hypothetical protein